MGLCNPHASLVQLLAITSETAAPRKSLIGTALTSPRGRMFAHTDKLLPNESKTTSLARTTGQRFMTQDPKTELLKTSPHIPFLENLFFFGGGAAGSAWQRCATCFLVFMKSVGKNPSHETPHCHSIKLLLPRDVQHCPD
eukprot:5756959-Amphidinium_carterae.7